MDAAQATEKRCRACGVTKPLTEFAPRPRMQDGHLNQCRECRRQHYAAWKAANAEALLKRRRAKYEANRPRELERMRAWRARNPRHNVRRRLEARLENLPISDESVDYAEIILRDPCAYCGGEATTLDHIVPLSDGGTHDWDNLTPACKPCNSRKNDGPILDALIRGTMLAEMENWTRRWEQAA